MELSYLACPYQHNDPHVMEARREMATHTAFRFIRQGILVYSPLTHDIPINQCGIFGDWQTWKTHNHEMLSRCDKIIVLKLPGWENSKGVQGELTKARQLELPIQEIEPDLNLFNEILRAKGAALSI